MELTREAIKKITNYLWEIPVSARTGMRVPALIFAKEEMLDQMMADRSLEQLMNVATLPGIQKAAIMMPDAHEGYGFPIGGIAATLWPDGVISPGGIGYDINCGVRLLTSGISAGQAAGKLEMLLQELHRYVPSGTGKGGQILLTAGQMDAVLRTGAEWAVKNGFGTAKDLERIECHGHLSNADPVMVSEKARQRGYDQLGTLGSGNHFLEVDKVETIYDEAIARVYGLSKGQLVTLIHTGSRGLGHQVATDYIRLMIESMPKYGINIKDRQLAAVPFSSVEGQSYFNAMAASANFAWCNRELISWEVREAWKKVFGEDSQLNLLYDVAHNMAKVEEYVLNVKLTKLIVHRKGATRAYGPGQTELPEEFRQSGQPVFIPGSMGTASYVLAGTTQSMETSFGSTCHGAGRRLSRTAAKKQVGGPQIKEQLKKAGIFVEASFKEIAEEAPVAYKDVDLVVDTVQEAGIARKVAQLRPLAVLKG